MGKAKSLQKKALMLFFTLTFLGIDCSRVEAAYVPEEKWAYEEVEPWAYYYPQKIRCTCYCEHQGTATLKMPYYGVVSGKKRMALGYVRAERNQ